MRSLRKTIIEHFTSAISRLIVVFDPDSLLLEEELLGEIQKAGFELIQFDDPLEFRYSFETQFRCPWDCGEGTDRRVVIRSSASDSGNLPYDLLDAAEQIAFNLGQLLPNLSYPVVASLNRSALDSLFSAQADLGPGALSDTETKDFALLHVYGVVPKILKEPHDLLRELLRIHYSSMNLAPVLRERLIEVLSKEGRFRDWPLRELVNRRETFFRFLQERWPVYLDRLVAEKTGAVYEPKAQYGIEIPGQLDLPFGHDDIRIYADSLFLEGLLTPIRHEQGEQLSETWASVGVVLSPREDLERRVSGLIRSLADSVPEAGARHDLWLSFAKRWAELLNLVYKNGAAANPERRREFLELRQRIDSVFNEWLSERYQYLYNLPPVSPVMVHHVPGFMAHILQDNVKTKVALIVIDGMALDQWAVIRDEINPRLGGFTLEESAVFAWIPTITSVSRQALFSGRVPGLFPETIYRSNADAALWSKFWADEGMQPSEVAYEKVPDGESAMEVLASLSSTKVRVAGLVVSKVDKIMHGMELGSAGMHNQMRQWARQGHIAQLMLSLLDVGFSVVVSSDHGNIEATGCGRLFDGVLAETRYQRARIYSEEALRARAQAQLSDTVAWSGIGLPPGCFPLIAADRLAFISKGTKTVTHGGTCLEEVIVPLVVVGAKEQS